MRVRRLRRTLAVAVVASLWLAAPASAQWFDFSWFRRADPTATPTTGPAAPTATRTRVPTFTPSPSPTRTLVSGGTAALGSPAQGLPAALLTFPLVRSDTESSVTYETRIELINLTSGPVELQCFYLLAENWFETGFFVTLTANQPLSWLASTGTRNFVTFTSVPPLHGEGELKCGVIPASPHVEDYNTVQGRAIVYSSDGQAAAYSAISFRRLTDGEFTGVFDLDGITYERCPSRMHFDVLAIQSGSASEIVLLPCSQDFLNQTPTTATASILITNEFEQTYSASKSIECWERLRLNQLSSTLNRSTLGSDTAHLMVRGVQASLLGLVLDKFTGFGQPMTTANEPFMSGGRTGQVVFP